MHDNTTSHLLKESTPDIEHSKRQFLLRLIGGQTIALGALAAMVAAGGLLLADPNLLMLIPIAGLAALIGAVSYWMVRRGHSRAGGYVFLIGTTLAITAIVSIRGFEDASALYYLWPILSAVSILTPRESFVIVLISAALYLVLVVAEVLGYHIPPLPYNAAEESLFTVGSRILMFFLLSFLVRQSAQALDRALLSERAAARRWRELNETLEQRVSSRTRALAKQSTQLETTARIARDAASVLDPHELLTRTVAMIQEQFGFYHTAIFLLDPSETWAILQAASGAGGQELLEHAHRLPVGETNAVGYAALHGEPAVILDVTADTAFPVALDLPETRSQVALPLTARDHIIGVLDVHSVTPNAFSEEDVAVLQTLADQMAMAISNSRLFQQAQESLEALQRAYGQASLENWGELLREKDLGYRYSESNVTPLAAGDAAEEPEWPALSIPVKHREQVIGTIEARKHDAAEQWTEREAALVETLSGQLSAALESARLYQSTQRRAAREQLAREITSDIRAASDVEDAIQRAVSALGRALHASHTVIRIGARENLLAGEEGETYDA
ncbi:MAG: GAF domain-containing protein [Anaerolineae bacterium]|nr:GAF domain-containing protein [Anaerolineae bacterium]